MRTVYFKVADMEKAVSFWQAFLEQKPPKHSQFWSEFKCDNINFGLLLEKDFKVEEDHGNFVPVFEFDDEDLEKMKNRALTLGASIFIDIQNHPDSKSYVLLDPFGNEFEITKFHD